MVYRDMPRIPRRYPLWPFAVLVVLACMIIFPLLARWTTDYLWYRDVQRTDVYWTMFWGRWLLGGAVGLTFFLLVFMNIFLALRETSDVTWLNLGQQLRERAIGMVDRTLRRVIFWSIGIVTGLLALGVGRAAADYWPQFLLFAHAQHVGVQDPIFHHDVGFYLFQLPAWELINHWLFMSVCLALVFTTIVYLSTRSIRKLRGLTISSTPSRVHLSILLALVFLVKAMQYFLDRFGVLYNTNNLMVGAGYTDVHAKLPGLQLMLFFSVVAAIIALGGIAFRNIKLLIWYVAGLMVASILVLGIFPSMVQRFRVVPNQRAMEAPYIKNHIDMTRQAYGLDVVKEQPFSPASRVTAAATSSSPVTMNNIRLWDGNTLQDIYQQRQALRTYYQILNVDIDRYQLGGQLRQVMLAAREMNIDQLPGEQTWVNRHLVYTHGYGVVMSPVNTFDPDTGEPLFFLKDVPPVSSQPELKVTRPEIYFGEEPDNYIVTHSTEKEFDYQRGESENVDTVYQEQAGVPLRNPLVRAMLASRFGSLDLLISNSITPDSRLLFRRQILDRAKAVAPFLEFDRDPYIIVGDNGRLYWMLDAYTRSIRYPYAQYTDLEISGGKTMQSNYVRNPVKVVIDAYNGSTRCYVIDEQEPFIRTWSKVFPHLFSPISEMPAGLAQHIRYPDGLFNVVSSIYQRYHMTRPNDFYQGVDLWDIPADPDQPATAFSIGAGAGLMPASYVVMSLPGENQPEYLLIRSYTPSSKDNMIAWISARNDPAHFGEMLAYRFSAQRSFYGPKQIQSRINTTPDFSQAKTLLGQAGSRLVEGNLLTIPIANSLLYVQPIYLRGEQAQIPELKRVIVADQEHVVMRNDLASALAALTGGKVSEPALPDIPQPPNVGNTVPPPMTDAQRALAREALDHYNRGQESMKRGDWTVYGQEMEQVRQKLEQLAK